MKLTIQQYGEFLGKVDANMYDNPSWRYGQAMFNTLYRMYPTLANTICDTPCDPYYSNTNVDKFVQAILLDTPNQ